MTIHLLVLGFPKIGGRKNLWKNVGSIRCCLTRS
nr:ribosomal protein L32 [Cymbidium wenshanense]